MTITVRLQAQARQLAGTGVVRLDLPTGASVSDAVTRLVEIHPALARLLLTQKGQVQPTLLLFRGDDQATANDVLAEGEELTVLAPMAGG